MNNNYTQEQAGSETLDRDLIRKLWTYLRPYRAWIALAIFFLVIARMIEALIPAVLGWISQIILTQLNVGSLYSEVFDEILHVCLILIGLLFFGYILDLLNIIIKSYVGQKAILKMRKDVFQHIEDMPIAYFDRERIGRLMTRVIHDIDQINQMFTESVIPIFGNIILFISIITAIFWIDVKLGVILILLLPVTVYLTNRFRINQQISYEKVRRVVSAMNGFIQEHLMGAFTIRTFGLEKTEKRQFEELNEDHRLANLDSIYHFALFISSVDVLQSVALIFVFFVLIFFENSAEGFQAGKFFTFSLYVLMFFRPLADLAERYNLLQSAIAAGRRVFDVLEKPIEPNGEESSLELKTVDTIEFDRVWFAYAGENWVLKDISFKIKWGESIAIVGTTGAGKTSLISLLLRFYPYQKGQIRVNGKPLEAYRVRDLRAQMSTVLQDPVIFSGTIEDNLTLFNPEFKREQVESVIKELGMETFLNRFPLKLDQRLSERGKSLSIGETQLISIARAMLYNRSVLILDEATASIDSTTEKMIQQALSKLLYKRASLVIAHRLSTIKDVNRILVLHQGSIVESGTHNELLALKGIYEKLYRLQFN